MKGEKHTGEIQKRLHELIQILKDSPYGQEKQLSPSVQNMLTEMTEILYKLAYYAEDWRKSNFLTRK
jgi:predicted nucleic acid-binding Zn ribbon protein